MRCARIASRTERGRTLRQRLDGVENVLPKITNMGRSTIELPISKFHGRLFDGIRLDGTLTGRVEIFRLEADVWMGEQQEEQ